MDEISPVLIVTVKHNPIARTQTVTNNEDLQRVFELLEDRYSIVGVTTGVNNTFYYHLVKAGYVY